jgi:hypothetical protein
MVGYAGEKKVTVCLEMLNWRVELEMKGGIIFVMISRAGWRCARAWARSG